MARRLIILALVAGLSLAGCAWFRDPPEQRVTTGATVVYAGNGFDLFSICDPKSGNLVYMTQKNPQVAIVKDGCRDAGPRGPSPAAVAALSERTPSPLPQPFLVQLVPAPGTAAATLPEPREPIVVQIHPSMLPCPTCPVAPPVLQGPAAARKPAAKSLAVAQVDPNTASAEDLERLPGVTAKMAAAIARGRPYRTLDDLVAKRVLTDAELHALGPYLVLR